MIRRDMVWRASGTVLMIGGCIAARIAADSDPIVLGSIAAALIGVVLVINGRRAVIAIRAERRGHGLTSQAVQRGRRGRSADARRRGARRFSEQSAVSLLPPA